MALNDQTPTTTRHIKAPFRVPAALHVALTPLFVAGLIGVYLGQRVLLSQERFALGVTLLGILTCVIVTALRFVPTSNSASHGAVARLLGAVQVLGLIGLGLYFLMLKSSPAGDVSPGRDAFQLLWISALLVSLVTALFGEGALGPMRHSSYVEVKRVVAACSSGLVLGLAAIYCSLLVYSAAKQEAQADFSYFKTASPGDATLKLVDQISEPIRIIGFFPDVSEVKKEVQTYLSRVAKNNPKLEIRLVDRYAEPKLAKELKVTTDGTIVLSRGETQQTLNVGVDLAKARPKLVALDKDFNSRLVKLMRSRRVAYLTTGHGELNENDRGDGGVAEGRTASVFKQLLDQQNYRHSDLGLAQGLGNKVPDDADIVFILGPTQPFTPEEIATLARYAEAGGKVFLALDVDGAVPAPGSAASGSAASGGAALDGAGTASGDGKPPSNLDWTVQLARAFGADFVPVILADEERFLVRRNGPSDHVILPSNRFSSHASVSTLSRNSGRASIVVSGAGYFKKTDAGPVQSEVTVRTFPSVFADVNANFKLDAGESKSAYSLGLALNRVKAGGSDTPRSKNGKKDDLLKADPKAEAEMRAFVFADADIFSDLLMARVPGNQMLAFDGMRWLGGEESLAGEIESEEDVRIEPTKQKEVAWFYATIFGVPVVVLLAGVLVSKKTRSQGGGKS